MATVTSGGRTARAGSLSRDSTTTGWASSWAQTSSTCEMSGRPAAWWRTLQVFERMRVPRPAARTNASAVWLRRSMVATRRLGRLGRKDSNLRSGIQSPLPYHLATPQCGKPSGTGLRSSLGRGVPAALGVVPTAPDELRDALPALAPELRVTLAPELALARLAALAAEIRIALRAELRLARLAALAAEIRVALRAELILARLTAPFPDEAVEVGTVTVGRVLAAALPGGPDAELSLGVHASTVRGQRSLARVVPPLPRERLRPHEISLRSERERARAQARASERAHEAERVRAIVRDREERRAASRELQRDAARTSSGPRIGDPAARALCRALEIVPRALADERRLHGSIDERLREAVGRPAIAPLRGVEAGEHGRRREADRGEHERDPERRRRRREGAHVLPPPGHVGEWAARGEEGDIRPDRRFDAARRQRDVPDRREASDDGRRVARASAEARRDRDPLADAHERPRLAPACGREGAHGPAREIVALRGADVGTDPHVEGRCRGHAHAVGEIHRREHAAEVVVPVRGPAAAHLEREVHLRVRPAHDAAAHERGIPSAFARRTHSPSESSSGRRRGSMSHAASTSSARARSTPASWPSAERSCLRRCRKASLTRRRNGSCASGANAGRSSVRMATTAEFTFGGGRNARGGTRRTIRAVAKDCTKMERKPRTLAWCSSATIRFATSSCTRTTTSGGRRASPMKRMTSGDVIWYGRFATMRVGRGPTAKRSTSSASACTTVAFGRSARVSASTRTMRASISTAVTDRARSASSRVRTPGPGPTSSTSSSGPISAASTMERRTEVSARKRWPSEVAARAPCLRSVSRSARGSERSPVTSFTFRQPSRAARYGRRSSIRSPAAIARPAPASTTASRPRRP